MGGCILVVEDQADNRQILRDLLGNAGYELIEVESGEDALAAVVTRRPDLILMDIQLPVMDGYEATKAIRSQEASTRSRRLPIVALTADAFDDDAVKARKAGMDGHLAKPYTRDGLREVLMQWL